jgi:hypothetical protein
MTDKKSSESRRKLLKSIAAGSGAVIAGKSLPEQWSRPIVDVALLPAHAQTSGCSSLLISLSWISDGTVDVDLELDTPGGSHIAAKLVNGVQQGQTLQHDGDDLGFGDEGTETISPITTGVTAGTYTVFVRNNNLFGGADYTVTVTGCATATLSGSIALDTYATAGDVVVP